MRKADSVQRRSPILRLNQTGFPSLGGRASLLPDGARRSGYRDSRVAGTGRRERGAGEIPCATLGPPVSRRLERPCQSRQPASASGSETDHRSPTPAGPSHDRHVGERIGVDADHHGCLSSDVGEVRSNPTCHGPLERPDRQPLELGSLDSRNHSIRRQRPTAIGRPAGQALPPLTSPLPPADDRPPICATCGVTMVPAALSARHDHDCEWVCLECEELEEEES
jgi:hypothetical protein